MILYQLSNNALPFLSKIMKCMWVSIINKSLNYRLANINRIQQKHSLPKTTNLENSLIVLPEYCSVKQHLKTLKNEIVINTENMDTNNVIDFKDCICKEVACHVILTEIIKDPISSVKSIGKGIKK